MPNRGGLPWTTASERRMHPAVLGGEQPLPDESGVPGSRGFVDPVVSVEDGARFA